MREVPNQLTIETKSASFLIDLITPVAAYLKLRDVFAGSVLLESSEYNSAHNSKSIIAINPIYELIAEAGILKIIQHKKMIAELPYTGENIVQLAMDFFNSVKVDHIKKGDINGFLGCQNYNVFAMAEGINPKQKQLVNVADMRYAIYEFVLLFDHYKHQLTITQNSIEGNTPSMKINDLYQIVTSSPITENSISISEIEHSDCSEEDFLQMVQEGKKHCRRGDVFQIVLSRNFWRSYQGDEFMLYRKLRAVNPSPYLFYYDFIDYQLLGSSPESQLTIADNKAIIHPIAGTYKRTGNTETDYINAKQLLQDEKENAEHIMLVDLARNDLSKFCDDVEVESYREVQMYSHVIHLVSKVVGEIKKDIHPFVALMHVSPAGTLSGAPKHKAMELIDRYEKSERSFYAGSVGIIGFDQSINQAITIRSCLLKNNTVYYRAGAGIVDASVPTSELQEVYNKTDAIRSCFKDLI